MAQVSTNVTGNGTTVDYQAISVSIPDSGNTYAVVGQVQRASAPLPVYNTNAAATNGIQLVNNNVTGPGVPGSGSNYCVIAVDWTTGTATARNSGTSLAAARALMTATEMEVANQVIPSTAGSNLSLIALTMPDSW